MAANGGSVTADLLRDLEELEKKMVDLAKAIPAAKYGWRPAAGVRSVGEVVMHVAADNYLIPAAAGHTPDPSTGIVGSDYTTAQAFEKRAVSPDSAVAEMQKSFAFLKKSLQETQATQLGEQITMFGQPFTKQQTWILAATHLHEHLGQKLAYARSNGVTPPWSN
jgi:uncharacterized damage-inducible protein DinB